MSKTSVDRVASGEIAIINSLLGEVSFEERKKESQVVRLQLLCTTDALNDRRSL